VENYAEPGIKLDYVGDGKYSNWDRFGRVTDQVWSDFGDPGNPADDAELDRFAYGYDLAGNRTYRANVVAGDLPSPVNLGEVYEYDEVYRFIGAERGDLDLTDPVHPVILSTTTNFAQDWNLDATGNWTAFTEDDNGDGTADLDQTRWTNNVNEITHLGDGQGPACTSPHHNRAGNGGTYRNQLLFRPVTLGLGVEEARASDS